MKNYNKSCRIHIFIDFWNFQLSLNKIGYPKIDWKKVGPEFTAQAVQLIYPQNPPNATFEGLHVYISYADKDNKLKGWANDTLRSFPGVDVTELERKRKSPPECPSCHKSVDMCPHCNADMRRKIEKGIDTAIVTDMIKLAWEDSYDVAVLVSSDRDFIPAVEFLKSKGLKIINARFRATGHDLAKICWGAFYLNQIISKIERK